MSNVGLNYKVYGLLTQIKQHLSPWAEYEQVKQWIEELDRSMERIGTKRFQVAVVGEFKRGKSSLINTLLQKEILPADVLPTTATFNRVVYGNVPRAYLRMKDGTTAVAPINDLAQYITKLSDEAIANARKIDEAVVEFPSMFCYDGRELIDTPGLNDDEEMTSVTVGRLKEIDLAIVAVSASYPFSATEAELIAQLLETSSVCQIIFAITMIDLIEEEDRERLLSTLKTRIQTGVLSRLESRHEPGDPVFEKYNDLIKETLIYPLSASQAQKALRLQDVALYEKSGYGKFTNELSSILLKSQEQNFVENVLRVTEQIIDKFLVWLDSYPGEIQRKITEIDDFKRTFGSNMYSILQTELNDWKELTLESSLLKGSDVYEGMIDQAWENAPQDSQGKVTAILQCLPGIYQALNEKLKNATYEIAGQLIAKCENQWQTLCLKGSEISNLGMEDISKKALETVEATNPKEIICAVFNKLADDSKDKQFFYWHLSPIPIDSCTVDENFLRYCKSAVKESLVKCVRVGDANLVKKMEEIHGEHKKQIQNGVMSIFQLVSQTAQSLKEKKDRLESGDGKQPFLSLKHDCQALREKTKEENRMQ